MSRIVSSNPAGFQILELRDNDRYRFISDRPTTPPADTAWSASLCLPVVARRKSASARN